MTPDRRATNPAIRLLSSLTGSLRRVGALGLAAALVLGATFAPLSGCGGGVGEGGTGYASGPITGFGSVIVNDIVFDDSVASVEDSDGAVRTRADLRLGMTVEIDSGTIASGGALARRVRFESAIVGPVDTLEADGFVVLGQRIAVDESTFFDTDIAAGLSALAAGDVVEVYGLFDAGLGRLRATRVEKRATAPLVYRVRGIVNALDPTGLQPTLRVGTAVFAYGAATNVPSNLAVGRFVRMFVSTTPPGLLGRYQVLRFAEALRDLPDTDGISLKGHVNAFNSLADFRVDGRPVDASPPAVVSGTVALGARVEVFGRWQAGVLQAERVVVRTDQSEREGFELRGPIESVAADRTSLRLRNVTVTLTATTTYENGTAADLAAGRLVEVRGRVSLGNGARLDALAVRFR